MSTLVEEGKISNVVQSNWKCFFTSNGSDKGFRTICTFTTLQSHHQTKSTAISAKAFTSHHQTSLPSVSSFFKAWSPEKLFCLSSTSSPLTLVLLCSVGFFFILLDVNTISQDKTNTMFQTTTDKHTKITPESKYTEYSNWLDFMSCFTGASISTQNSSTQTRELTLEALSS